MKQSLNLSQSQSLVMTQSLQQSIKLLQYSSQELEAFVLAEMEKNPLLNEDDGRQEDVAAEAPAETQDTESGLEIEKTDVFERDEVQAEYADRGERERRESQQSSATEYSSPTGSASSENLIEKMAYERPSLRDYLKEHLYCSTDDMAQRLIGVHLIDLVSANGYLAPNYKEVAEQLQCEAGEVEQVVDLLQECEPAGLCARNLSDCMALQLQDQGEYTESMQALVANLQLLAKAEFAKLQKLCGVPRDELQEMVELIKSLNPKPGYAFEFEEVQAVQPDIFVRGSGQDWDIELNGAALPKVLVNNNYYTILSESTRNKEEKTYLSEQLTHANWLVKALDQRAHTMLKTATEIVKRQSQFLRHGVRYLKPLTLREVADAIEMHESTISRVTSNKYLSHNGALYELKYFFTSSIGSSFGGDNISSKAVQHAIEKLISQEESAKTVLSDEAIATALNDDGMNIARRTVAKYRDILKIPSSAQRKRIFKSQI